MELATTPGLAGLINDERVAYLAVVTNLRVMSPAKSVAFLEGADLDRWFGTSLGPDDEGVPVLDFIAKHDISVESMRYKGGGWRAHHLFTDQRAEGATPELAIKRCWVAKVFGHELDGSPGPGA